MMTETPLILQIHESEEIETGNPKRPFVIRIETQTEISPLTLTMSRAAGRELGDHLERFFE
jgi:hypothetical protein